MDQKITTYLNRLKTIYPTGVADTKAWLDVGCGHGEFIAAVKRFAPEIEIVRGTEPNTLKQASARERGLDVEYFDLTEHSARYDVISLLNVYSHLPDPPSFLKSLGEKLTEGGEILLEAGDTAEMASKDHFRPFLLPDHLSFASEKIVTDILHRSGFEIMSIHRFPYWTCTPKNLILESIKALIPKKQSKIKYLLNKKRYGGLDMYLRARLK